MDPSKLTTEAANPASSDIDRLSAIEIVRVMGAEDSQVAAAVATQDEAIAEAIEAVANRLRSGGRLIYLGAGTSGRLGVLDASECPPTFNSPPEQVVGVIAGGHGALVRSIEGAEDHSQHGERDLREAGLTPGDAVVGIATSGRTPYVLGGLRYAQRTGALTVGLACNEDTAVAAASQITITPVVGPEIISGSTRLKAGTATKMVLNMISTGAMVRIGKTYGNLMVDLRATNSKLRDRSRRIVASLAGITESDAGAILARNNGEVKTAIVAHLLDITGPEARRRLQVSGGQLRPLIEGRHDNEKP